MSLNIFVSNICFIYCKGCYSYSREEKCKSVLSTEVLEKFLKYAYSYGIDKVTLCGGDPLAREDIINLLKKIKNIGFAVAIDTIGTPLIRDVNIGKRSIKKLNIAEMAKLIDYIGIPIDGSSNNIIRLFRPTTNDILNELLSICKILNDNRVKICINTVAHKGNKEDAKNLAKIIKRIKGVYKWQVFQFAPLGKYGFLNRKIFEISEKEFEDFRRNVLEEFGKTKKTLEFKKNKDRVKHYMLIDNSGNAWVPEFERIITDENNHFTSERLLIGNITNIDDWDKICRFVKKKLL